MEKVNALRMRQSLGRVLRKLEQGGRPVLVERSRKPVAVLVSLEDYQHRFADREADEARQALVARIKSVRLEVRGESAAGILHSLRHGRR